MQLEAVEKLVKKQELERILTDLRLERIEVLLMKGMPLSFLIYAYPHLRPFADIDIFIRRADFEGVRAALESRGYRMTNAVSGEHVAHQRSFEKKDVHGVEHIFDVHWKISNPLVFSEFLTFEEAFSESLPVPALGPYARTLSLPHALLLACVHRVAHHADDPRPVWLKDIHLLVGRMTSDDLRKTACLARARRMTAVLRDGLDAARRSFGTVWSEQAPFEVEPKEPCAGYLTPGPSRWRDLRYGLRTLNGFRQKFWYLKELALPRRDYMLEKYGPNRPYLLPIFYLRRILIGIVKLFTSSKKSYNINKL